MASHDDPLAERFVDVEMKLTWHDQKIEDLSAALVDKERRVTELEARVQRLEKALQILAARASAPKDEIAGALDIDDPVPRSG